MHVFRRRSHLVRLGFRLLRLPEQRKLQLRHGLVEPKLPDFDRLRKVACDVGEDRPHRMLASLKGNGENLQEHACMHVKET